MTHGLQVANLLVLPLLSGFVFPGLASSNASMFDLVCERVEGGMEIDGEYRKSPAMSEDARSIRVSINLSAATWCYRPCRRIGTLKFDNSEIKLTAGPQGLGMARILINRNSGVMVTGSQINKTMILLNTFQCTKAAYTTIPPRKF